MPHALQICSKGLRMDGLTLWHRPCSPSLAVLWLLEEIGVPYRLVRLGLEDDPYPESAVPALRDGDRTLHECGAMVEWLCETRAPHLWRAPGSEGRLGWLDWMYFAEGLRRDVAAGDPQGRLTVLNAWLDGSEWLLSEFSGADCHVGAALLLALPSLDLGTCSQVRAYLARIRNRPAVRGAVT